MTAAMRQRGSAGRSCRRFPRLPILARLAFACLLGALALGSRSAQAEVLYRCTGSSGEAVFTSKTAGYRACRYCRPVAV